MISREDLETLNTSHQSPLRLAFIGGGVNSAVGRAHRIALEMDQRFELVAGCFSRNPEKSQKSAKAYGLKPEFGFSDFDLLLNDLREELDAVVILTPQDQHYYQVTSCIQREVPVICEKALATTSLEAIKIKDQLVEKDGFLAVTYNYTGYPMIRELKDMIGSGRLGAIHQVNIEMPQEGFLRLAEDGTPMTPQEWRLRDGLIPTLSLDLGVHLHMMLKFLLEESPQEVIAVSSSNGHFSQIKDGIHCIAKYSGNIICNIWYSKTSLGCRNGLNVRIFGQKGSAAWVQENPEYIEFADEKGSRYRLDRTSNNVQIAGNERYQRFKAGHPAGFIEAFSNYYTDVADTLEQYKANKNIPENNYVFGIQESIDGLKMLEAIENSCNSGCWERV